MKIMKTLTHDEYLAWQTLLQMTPYDIEQVDTICTSLINLGMTAMVARSHALHTYRLVKDATV